jgi:hypothetical protein
VDELLPPDGASDFDEVSLLADDFVDDDCDVVVLDGLL